MKTRIYVVEPDAELRKAIRPHLSALGENAGVIESVDGAPCEVPPGQDLLVIVRSPAVACRAAEFACGLDLCRDRHGVRLVVMGTTFDDPPSAKAVAEYLHELDQVIARVLLPPAERIGSSRAKDGSAIPADFPHDAYEAIRHMGELRNAHLLLVRNRVTGEKELLVQIEDSQAGAEAVSEILYAEHLCHLNADPRRRKPVLRHEMTGYHSFVTCATIPVNLAEKVERASLRWHALDTEPTPA
ncbi:hypothetical protein DSM104443_01747 [Usitatibacter rugosus]|uniref:Uncharacterized protein n=1 Tax=Usitatibacter rugosus TaxID=2732067 RepID=A0A6M4GTN1_9PROT|nr:hypothetical protein [Usitatibacter rugosus]QJR10680.1 hypothetical protein DSM104443_01747 [Usitatibacter rugosus]